MTILSVLWGKVQTGLCSRDHSVGSCLQHVRTHKFSILNQIWTCADTHTSGSEIAAEILLQMETFCLSQPMIACVQPERQMSRCVPQMKAVGLSGKCTVPWSSLWQKVILASSTSGPGWSRTRLHHLRGLRTLSSCSLALGLAYSLERTIRATLQSFTALLNVSLYGKNCSLKSWRPLCWILQRSVQMGEVRTLSWQNAIPWMCKRSDFHKLQMQIQHRSLTISSRGNSTNCESSSVKWWWLDSVLYERHRRVCDAVSVGGEVLVILKKL